MEQEKPYVHAEKASNLGDVWKHDCLAEVVGLGSV